MPERNQPALDFLLTRRSRPAKTLTTPVPGRAEVEVMLTAAARSPDHGKLEPWRFVVLTRPALERLAGLCEAQLRASGLDEDQVKKAALQYADAHLAIAVVSVPRPTVKIPRMEQILSAGAVCLALLNAALASGWGANWLTGRALEDETFLRQGLGLAEGEFVAGMIHIGTETSAPPDRPRPDIAAITTWVAA